jgi:hypothetical protein
MTHPKVLNPKDSYTFSQYFSLPFDRADILTDLDCRIDRQMLTLPRFDGETDHIEELKQQIYDGIKYVGLGSEQARREFLIAPVIREVCRQSQQQVRVEYPVTVSNWLRGSFDYYFQNKNLLVIEAKRDNLDSGFTQLATELIALDQWSDADVPILYGAVTTGENWRFGIFQRQERLLLEDMKLYRVPEELERLLRILLGITRSN